MSFRCSVCSSSALGVVDPTGLPALLRAGLATGLPGDSFGAAVPAPTEFLGFLPSLTRYSPMGLPALRILPPEALVLSRVCGAAPSSGRCLPWSADLFGGLPGSALGGILCQQLAVERLLWSWTRRDALCFSAQPSHLVWPSMAGSPQLLQILRVLALLYRSFHWACRFPSWPQA